jgi:hypothetical protein
LELLPAYFTESRLTRNFKEGSPVVKTKRANKRKSMNEAKLELSFSRILETFFSGYSIGGVLVFLLLVFYPNLFSINNALSMALAFALIGFVIAFVTALDTPPLKFKKAAILIFACILISLFLGLILFALFRFTPPSLGNLVLILLGWAMIPMILIFQISLVGIPLLFIRIFHPSFERAKQWLLIGIPLSFIISCFLYLYAFLIFDIGDMGVMLIGIFLLLLFVIALIGTFTAYWLDFIYRRKV